MKLKIELSGVEPVFDKKGGHVDKHLFISVFYRLMYMPGQLLKQSVFLWTEMGQFATESMGSIQ